MNRNETKLLQKLGQTKITLISIDCLAAHKPTVEELHSNKYNIPGLGEIYLEILDTSGTFEFPAMRQLSIEKGDAFILVFSVTDPDSWQEVIHLRQMILEQKGEHSMARAPPSPSSQSFELVPARGHSASRNSCSSGSTSNDGSKDLDPSKSIEKRGSSKMNDTTNDAHDGASEILAPISSIYAAATRLTSMNRRASCLPGQIKGFGGGGGGGGNGSGSGGPNARAKADRRVSVCGASDETNLKVVDGSILPPSCAHYNNQLSRLIQQAPMSQTSGKLLDCGNSAENKDLGLLGSSDGDDDDDNDNDELKAKEPRNQIEREHHEDDNHNHNHNNDDDDDNDEKQGESCEKQKTNRKKTSTTNNGIYKPGLGNSNSGGSQSEEEPRFGLVENAHVSGSCRTRTPTSFANNSNPKAKRKTVLLEDPKRSSNDDDESENNIFKRTTTPIVVVANKCDLDIPASISKVDLDSAESLVRGQWANSFVRCSARDAHNIDKVFRELLRQAQAPEILSQFVIDDNQQRRQSLPVLKNQLSVNQMKGLRNLYSQQQQQSQSQSQSHVHHHQSQASQQNSQTPSRFAVSSHAQPHQQFQSDQTSSSRPNSCANDDNQCKII